MSYLVLARKYRPQSFEDLVGQEHVARTLANAIDGNRVAHAFLFTGVRGVGKTTSARLLAKCLNCLGAAGDPSLAAGDFQRSTAKGPTAKPCQVCAACKEIAAGNDIDVQEIDGASYNGVDEVRRLQEGLAFRPARDRFKIYIVDEVHMLSNAAWNAFLKTLEEPPPHVKFIFATTEVHKVPVTILSRCQRYDFKLISTQLIAKRLNEVLGLESIEADGAAVSVIAREAAGSMRDAMSLLDQVIAFSGTKLASEDVARVLGVADRRVLHELGDALVSGNATAALRVVDSMAQQGFDLPHLARDVLQYLRNLVVAKVSGEEGRGLLDLADEEVADVLALTQKTDADDLMRLYQGFSKSFDDVVKSGQPRAALEMLLVRLARRPALLPLDELLVRLGELERRLGGAPPAPRGGGSAGSGGAKPPAQRSRGGDRPDAFNTAPASQDAAPASWEAAPASWEGVPAVSQPAAPARVVPPPPPPPRQDFAPPPPPPPPRQDFVPPPPPPPRQDFAPPPPPPPPRQDFSAPPPPRRDLAPPPPPRPDFSAPPPQRQDFSAPPPPTPTPRADFSASPPPPREEAAPVFAPPTGGGENLASWRRVVERVRATRPPLASVLEHAIPVEIGSERVRIALDEFLAFQVREAEALSLVTQELRSLFGEVSLSIDDKTPQQATVATLASMAIAKKREELSAARNAVAEHPLVRHAIALFNADLREVRLPAGSED